MDLEESRFRATWKRFLEVLKVDHNCSLADVCRKQHTTLGDMSSWMSRRGYSFKQARKDVVRDYYNGVAHSRTTTSSPSFTQIVPIMLSEEEFSLSGITITFNRTAECNRTHPLKNTGNYFLINGKRLMTKKGSLDFLFLIYYIESRRRLP